ncbi:MAG: LPS export ABC transporter periplasmic protein LptC [Bacteroides sp.]|nr:LPS export ABC transporter periplasmic protein LptC [Prevotella sp.]MCM1407718.1 LPS export ABC transporter periplasmic protein LptC [Treponema brennaborense]MCM1469132.1 LPS export ABC transporter periplasmic protein LptC [Bacteroides sp.]
MKILPADCLFFSADKNTADIRRRKKTIAAALQTAVCSLLLLSCSLKYDSDTDDAEGAPELIFSNVSITRLEDSAVSVKMESRQMEQYRGENAVYAKDISFSLFNKNNEIILEGKCGMLSADNDAEVYGLFSDVEICNYEQNMKISAQNIKWNNKTEQLTSEKNDIVCIAGGQISPTEPSRDGGKYAKPQSSSNTKLDIRGTGFSASGVSMSYQFEQLLEGTIETDDAGNLGATADRNESADSAADAPRDIADIGV